MAKRVFEALVAKEPQQGSERDGSGFHQFRLNAIMFDLKNSIDTGNNNARLASLVNLRNETIPVMSLEEITDINKLFSRARKLFHYPKSFHFKIPPVLDDIDLILRRIADAQGLTVRREKDWRGATGK